MAKLGTLTHQTHDFFSQCYIYSPFDLNHDWKSHLSNFDPDLNMYNTFHRSSYDHYSKDNFNAIYHHRHDVSNLKLTMKHSNIRSIPCCLTSFYAYVDNLSMNSTVIAFTEAWLKDTHAHAFGIGG